MINKSRLNFDRISLAAFVLLSIYQLIGAFPLVTVFGDGIGVANGAKLMLELGVGDNPLAYNYSQHPGVHIIVAGISYLTKMDTQRIYLIISLLSSIVFICLSALLIRRLLLVSFGFAGITILLFQEAYSAGYYANSTVVAGSLAILSLWILSKYDSRPHTFVAGILLGFATLMRLDAIILVLPAIVLIHGADWHKTISRAAIFGISSAIVIGCGLWLTKFNLLDVLHYFSFKSNEYDSSVDRLNTLLSHAAFFSILSILLIAMGLWTFIRDREWKSILLVLSIVFPTYLLYSSGIDNPRYFYYTLPFFALCATAGLRWSWRILPYSARFVWVTILVIAFVFQYPLGIREIPKNERWSRFQLNTGISLHPNWQLVLMPRATVLVGHNGGRLSSGLLFAPLWHHHSKLTNLSEVMMVDRIVAEHPKTIIVVGWTPCQRVIDVLLKHKYSLAGFQQPEKVRERHTYYFSDGTKDLKFIYLNDLGIQRVMEAGFSAVVPEINDSAVAFVGFSYIINKLKPYFPNKDEELVSAGRLRYLPISISGSNSGLSQQRGRDGHPLP